MPDNVDKPRRRRGKLLLQSAAITTSALMVWCNRAQEEPVIYANPKGPTYDTAPDATAAPEPPDTAGQNAPEPSASVAEPAPSEKSAEVAKAGPPDAGAPDAKAPGAKPTAIPHPPKPRIYANPKGSLYEIPADEPLREPAQVNPARRPGRGSARG